MEVDLVPSRKLDDPMTGWVSEVGREPAANGNTGSRITHAEVPPSEAEKCNEPSKVLVKESICSSFENLSFAFRSSQKTEANLVAPTMLKAGLKYRQLRQEKREEKEAAYNNKMMVRSLYGTAHILEVKVMTQIQNNSNINAFCKGGENRGGGGDKDQGGGIPVTREGGGAGGGTGEGGQHCVNSSIFKLAGGGAPVLH